MVRETGVQSQVESYQRFKKWYLMPPCLAQHYKVGIKGKMEQSREWSSALHYSSMWKLLKRKVSGHPRLRSPTLLTIYIIIKSHCWHGLPWFSLTPSLSSIAPGRLFKLLPASTQSWWRYVFASRQTLAHSYATVYRRTSLMSSSLLLQQCPACLVRDTWMFYEIGGKWPYSCCFAGFSYIAGKVDNTLFLNRIGPKIEKILRKHQNFFRRNRSKTLQIITIHRIIEGVRAKSLGATQLFVDFSIHREKMEQIFIAYGLPKETVTALYMLYRNIKVKVCSPDGNTDFFNIVAGFLQRDTLAPYLFINCLDFVLRTKLFGSNKRKWLYAKKSQEADDIPQKL